MNCERKKKKKKKKEVKATLESSAVTHAVHNTQSTVTQIVPVELILFLYAIFLFISTISCFMLPYSGERPEFHGYITDKGQRVYSSSETYRTFGEKGESMNRRADRDHRLKWLLSRLRLLYLKWL